MNRSTTLTALSIFMLIGCAVNPTVPVTRNVTEFANAISGKRFEFNVSHPVFYDSINGYKQDEDYGFVGLRVALAPLQSHCSKEAGSLTIAAKNSVGGRLVPSIITCSRGARKLWLARVSYGDVKTTFLTVNRATWLSMVLWLEVIPG